ncbi:DUF6090 family protein [Balneola sp. MJW-20]|uniref:DUF6090 family protein n=1 Tax=Gracilimonas aurantiaca TaxID=3234185 RepID=UPI0034652427
MITLFRRIREKLIASGSVTKYLLYAIGEILLVVIGILIALQVNNWNENRKASDYEQKVLMEIKNAAQSDIDNIHNYLVGYRGAQRKQSYTYFDRVLKGETAHEDSLIEHYGWLLYSDTFQYNSGPYESIKSSGLDKISNDSLRGKLANIYDFTLPRNKELIDWRYGRFEKTVEEHLPALLEDPRTVIIDGEVRIRRPYKMIDFTSNEHFLFVYGEAKSAYYWNEERYISSVNLLRELVSLIDLYLQIEGDQ